MANFSVSGRLMGHKTEDTTIYTSPLLTAWNYSTLTVYLTSEHVCFLTLVLVLSLLVLSVLIVYNSAEMEQATAVILTCRGENLN